MAVLHLILQGNTAARGIPELAPVITKHNDWIAGKKFLLVPYHMIGSPRHGVGHPGRLRRLHPPDSSRCADPAASTSAEGLFRDAENLRKQMGDDRFFETLGDGADRPTASSATSTGRGTPSGSRPRSSRRPGSEERSQLISAAHRQVLRLVRHAGWRPRRGISRRFDKGLSVISKHAASLGYDGADPVPRRADPLAGQPSRPT